MGVVSALPAEARCIGTDPRVLSRAAGIGHEAARATCDSLLAAGVRALVSWGCAAGLDRSLTAGTLVLPDLVVPLTPRGERAGDLRPTESWAATLARRLDGNMRVVRGAIACPHQVLGTSAAKQALAAAHPGALAADMESAAVGRAGAAAGVPWVVVRAIADTADVCVPLSFGFAIDHSGRLRPLRFAAGLVRHPSDLAAIPALARGFRLALRALRDVARSAGPTLLAPLDDGRDAGGFA